MQYQIVNTDTMLFLEQRVTHYINLGWVPQGGICVTIEDGSRRYYQALIKNTNL